MQCLPPVEDQIVRHGVGRLRQSRSPPEVDRFPPEMVFAFLLLYERVTLGRQHTSPFFSLPNIVVHSTSQTILAEENLIRKLSLSTPFMSIFSLDKSV